MKQLTLFDYHKMPLEELEKIVARGLGTFIEVGMALLAIREERKYKEVGYSDFNVYLRERWGMSMAQGNRILNAGYIATEVVQVLPIGNTSTEYVRLTPKHESQVRPLARLGNYNEPAPELWATAWIRACEIAEGRVPTAKEVEFVVKDMLWHEPDPIPDGSYRVIYADPPWRFDNSGFDQSAEQQYPVMLTSDICNIYVPCADNAVLFLWATNSMIKDALEVIEAWQFNYKTNFVWVKSKGPTMGFYTQSRHELLLIGTRGENMLPEVRPVSIIRGKVTEHSKKPEMYDTIESMYDGPYLELFARNEREGWESWGNELPE